MSWSACGLERVALRLQRVALRLELVRLRLQGVAPAGCSEAAWALEARLLPVQVVGLGLQGVGLGLQPVRLRLEAARLSGQHLRSLLQRVELPVDLGLAVEDALEPGLEAGQSDRVALGLLDAMTQDPLTRLEERPGAPRAA